MQRGARMWRRAALAAIAVPFATTLLGVGTAHAATIDVNPASVAPGGTLTIVGDEWFGTVTFVFIKGNTVLQAGNASTGPNGGSISTTRSAPTDPGDWQLCADGQNILDGAFVSMCTSFTVTAPPTTTAKPVPTTVAPTTTLPPTTTSTTSTTSTTTSTTSTTVAETTTTETSVAPASSTTPEPSSPPTTPAPTVPGGTDGVVTFEEEPSSTDGSGLSGLTIGLIGGVVALTGLGVVGLLSSSVGDRPRPAGAIGVGVAGAVIAGALAIAMPPPQVNVPKLAAMRVQVSRTITRSDSPRTITAPCPTGTVVIGGGYRTDWASMTIDDKQPLINWLETVKGAGTGRPQYVYDTNRTSTLAGRDGVNQQYWYVARLDRTVHFSDFVWPSGQRSWASANVVGTPSDQTVPWRPEWAADLRDEYYQRLDTAPSRKVGVLVSASAPVEQGWEVALQVPSNSLQSSVNVQVVATCAPRAASTADDGVVGARVVTAGTSGASCEAGETVLAAGWRQAPAGGVARVEVSTAGRSGGSFVGDAGAASVVLVCATKDGLEVSTASGSGTARGGSDGVASAECPGGTFAVGGGLTTNWVEASGAAFSGQSQSLLAALPTGPRSFGVGFRALLVNFVSGTPTGEKAPEPFPESGVGGYPLSAYPTIDTTTMTAVAVCARRVVAGV